MKAAGYSLFEGGGDLGSRMRVHDWARSPLGSIDSWPGQLKTLVGVMLGAKQAMFTAWGPELTLLYNDAYRLLLGSKDHAALGAPFMDVWAEVQEDLLPLVERALSGESVHMDDLTLLLDREGQPSEAHFAFSYTPVRGDDGTVLGIFCVCGETTPRILAEQRQAFRLEVEQNLHGLHDAEAIIRSVATSLGRHLRANRVGYGEVGEDGHTAKVSSVYLDGMVPLEGTLDTEAFGKVFVVQQRSGRTVAVADIRATTGFEPETWDRIGTRAFVVAPILRAGRLKTMLFVNQSQPRRWSRDEVVLIEDIASRVNDAVERLQAEQEAKASAVRFRTLTQAIPNQVWTAGPA